MKWGPVAYFRKNFSMILTLSILFCVLIFIGYLALADGSGLDGSAAHRAGQNVVSAEGPALIEVSAPYDTTAAWGAGTGALPAAPAAGEAGPWPPVKGPVGIERLARFSH